MSPAITPSYLQLDAAQLSSRVSGLRELSSPCCLCPRHCGVDRLSGELSACRVGAAPMVSSYSPHFGEEAPLVGQHGSGTIFLTGCNLKCVFCQNHEISHELIGEVVTVQHVAEMMLSLQRRGCHNINWVTPTHQVPALVAALSLARDCGLHLPIVYNCGGYESLEVLQLLDGLIDIFMPDAKYADNDIGARLSGVPDYWDRCREALTEMHRQVGDLEMGEDGIARRGLLVRHLLLPNGLSGTEKVVRFVTSLSTNTYLNVMGQFLSLYRASTMSDIARGITQAEANAGYNMAREAGLSRIDHRPRAS